MSKKVQHHDKMQLELKQRQLLQDKLRSYLFAEQLEVLDDPSRFLVLFGPRRIGKTTLIAVSLIETALLNPGCSLLYLGLTKASSIQTVKKDLLEPICARFGIKVRYTAFDSSFHFDNGSILYVRGADANETLIHRAVGQRYHLSVFDEASLFRIDVERMVNALLPALGDFLGRIILAGTPSNVAKGKFYDLTYDVKVSPEDPHTRKTREGWSIHSWHWSRNLPRHANLQKQYDDLIASQPRIVETNGFKREWQGWWCVDEGRLVYRVDRTYVTTVPDGEVRREITQLPANSQYDYMLGVDLGIRDKTAFGIWAHSEYDKICYLVYCQGFAGMSPHAIAEHIRSLWDCPERGYRGKFRISRMVCDEGGLGKMIGAEFVERYGLPIEPVSKSGSKRGIIEAMNAEYQLGQLKILPQAYHIFEEYDTLVWDEKARSGMQPKWVEHPALPNDLADAALYAWRTIKQYGYSNKPEPALSPYDASREAERQIYEQELRIVRAQYQARQDFYQELGITGQDFTSQLIQQARRGK